VDYIFRLFLDQHPVGLVIPGPGVIFDRYNSVIPDLVYIRRERADMAEGIHLMEAPDLVVEIISPGKGNSERDRKMKRQIYSRYGAREYWILDPQARIVEVYRRWGRGLRLVATLSDMDALTTPLIPGFSCHVHRIFAAQI
jgi:Uma2 family endonuclease